MTNWNLEGEVLLELEGNTLLLRGEGKRVILTSDALPEVLRELRYKQNSARLRLKKLAESLHQVGLTLRIGTSTKLVAILGSEAKVGLFSRLLGIPHAEVKLNGVSLKILKSQAWN